MSRERQRPPKPIESFGPELFQALVEGSKREVKFKLPYRKATRFRLRVNQLRETMRLTQHSEYRAVSQARLTIRWPEGTPTKKYPGGNEWPLDKETVCDVIISPSDAEFIDALKTAGVEVKPLSEAARAQPDGPSDLEEDVLAKFVRDAP